jgi:hypothetical protein
MHRAVTVAVVLAVLAGSVPAAATLADGTPSNTEPGASFAAVVGVQGAEVDNEIANRSLNQRFAAANSNSSKASVVASESQSLEVRLAELEAEKATVTAAYENGSISKGQYTAQLAVLSAKLRAVERRANRTAETADTLPAEALEAKGTNVSAVRAIARQANRTGGGEVAESARGIDGAGVGNGLGQPASAGRSTNATDRGNSAGKAAADAGKPENVSNNGPADAGNGSRVGGNAPADPKNGSQASGPNASANRTRGKSSKPNGSAAGAPVSTANRTVNGGDTKPETASTGSNRPGSSSAANDRGKNNTTTRERPMVGEITLERPGQEIVADVWADLVEQTDRVTQPLF